MKYDKIQNEIMKATFKHISKGGPFDYIVSYDEEKEVVYVIDHGYIMTIIPERLFILDVDLLEDLRGHSSLNTCKKLLENSDKGERAILSNERRIIIDKNKKIEAAKIQGENEAFAWVDVKYLKYFELDGLTFNITKPTNPIYIYENDDLVGLVMPVRVKE